MSSCLLEHRIPGGHGAPLPATRTSARIEPRAIINPDTPQAEEMDCMETRVLPAGTVVRLEQTGGGGYGNPFERPKELVVKDIDDGYVSPQAAAAQYKFTSP